MPTILLLEHFYFTVFARAYLLSLVWFWDELHFKESWLNIWKCFIVDCFQMENAATFVEFREHISNLEANEVFLQKLQWWL